MTKASRRFALSELAPSRRLVWLGALPMLLSAATLVDASLVWPVLGLDVLVVLACLVDALVSRREHIDARFDMRDVLSVGTPNPVWLELDRTAGRRPLDVLVRVDIPVTMSTPDLPLALRLAGTGRARGRFHVIPTRRGAHRLGPVFVRIPSRFGLWTRQVALDCHEDVRVYPNLAPIRSYELLAREHRQSALVRASRLKGGETEFSRLRDYAQGDDYRSIDWKATARRSVLTAREYQLESDQNIMLLVDAGRLMTAEIDGITQFDHALGAALMLSYVATRGGDRVGISCFDSDVQRFVPPVGGPDATARLVRASFDVHPRLVEPSFRNALGTFDARVKQRCLVVMFTELFDETAVEEIASYLRQLRRRHLPLLVVLENPELGRMVHGKQTSPSLERDLFERSAAAELLGFRAAALESLRKSGALVLECQAGQLSTKVVNRYLELKAQRAL